MAAGTTTVEDGAQDLLRAATSAERLALLEGGEGFWRGMGRVLRGGARREPYRGAAVGRLGVPGIAFTDGPRGVALGASTCFPVAMARAATWDVALEEEVGRAIGAEARALGADVVAAPCVNLLRHPGWGRAQETYGEDPVLLGAMGAALTRGLQAHVMACAKHFALNSIEDSRFALDVRVDERALHEVHLPHFRTVVEAGVDWVMTAYNAVNGTWCGQSRVLLADVLRHEWGFRGATMSDFVWGVRDPVASVQAGLDVEMPFRQQRHRALPRALRRGLLAPADVDAAACRVLAVQLRYALRHRGSAAPDPGVVAGPEHRALTRRAAAQALVLLRNEPVEAVPLLPLDRLALRRVAVLGRLGEAADLGDQGSSAVHPPATSSVLDGLRAALPGAVVAADDGSDLGRAAEVAAGAEVAVVVVGCTADDEGEALRLDVATVQLMPGPFRLRPVARLMSRLVEEGARRGRLPGGDRRDLGLRVADRELVATVAAANERTVVLVVAGSAVVEDWQRVPAVLQVWYPGMAGGHAIADVLTGAREPGGRLPFAVPLRAEDLPAFDPDARHVTYDRWWGQRLLDRDGRLAAHPLGSGLGYTTFALHDLRARVEPDGIRADVRVTNTGPRTGSTVVQLYARPVRPGGEDHRRQLLGFARTTIDPGHSRDVEVTGSLRPLNTRDPRQRRWALRPDAYRLEAAQHSGDPAAATTTLRLGGD